MLGHRWVVRLYLDSCLNLYHASSSIAGLSQLSRSGLLALEIETPTSSGTSYSGSPLIIRFDVTDKRLGSSVQCAIDLYDRSDRFSLDQISSCDLYYKRSYYPPDLTTLPPHLLARVRPFGLNYASRDRVSPILLPLLRDYALRLTRAALQNPRQLRDEIQQVQLRGFLRSPLVSDFERAPATNGGPMQILYQTRLWPQVGAGESLDEINDQRICLTRTLKNEFPRQFRGGLMPDDFSRRHCPDLLSREPTGRRNYIEWSRSCEIGVYSRGLHHSQAFKLGEYFASSKCIIMDEMRNHLPIALVHGENYLQFDNPSDCAAHCETLLSDPSRARAMQETNWAYYRAAVSPSSRMRTILENVSHSIEIALDNRLSTTAI